MQGGRTAQEPGDELPAGVDEVGSAFRSEEVIEIDILRVD